MNILKVNKYFYINGGVARYFFELSEILKGHGHNISFFSTGDKKNRSSKFSKYFVSNISFNQLNITNALKGIKRIFYSREADRKISQLLDDYPLDIVHLHSIYHHLSPSIIVEIKKRNIPIVQTVHDYHLVSPSRSLFHHNQICEITKRKQFYKAIFHKCVKNSYLVSFAEVVEKYFHYLLGWERNNIDYFLAPSVFMRDKLIEYGLDSQKIIYLPLFIDCQSYKLDVNRDNRYILYFGRLSEEKGLNFLIDVMSKLQKINLKIVGRGSKERNLKSKVKKMRLNNVEFLGFRDSSNLKKIISGSRFTILPSLWYDVAPISILESFACGKPMVASSIGGIPETVKDGYNGFLFEPGNIEDCREKVVKLWDNPLLCRKMGQNARKYVEKNFGPEDHYRKLMKIYQKAINKHKL